VVDAPYLSGNQAFVLGLLISLLSVAVGFYLWFRASKPLHERGQQMARAMCVLAGIILVGTVLGLLGWWVLGLIFFAITVLGIGVAIGYLASRL
jgi:hypothetical protein